MTVGLTVSAAAVAATLAADVPTPGPASGAPVDPTAVAGDAWADHGSGAGDLPFAAPVRTGSLRSPVSARGTDAARRLARPAYIPAARYDDVPDAALVAYQRAVVVLEAADRACGLDWQLLAAVARVRSDHGRTDGGRLGASGIVRPALVGRRLDGRRNTPRIKDTDAGQLDGDRRFDRAVGPMQVLPSTWSVVGVDADGDGRRNPQDIDDAALATAVHLCSGEEDLARPAGRRAALRLLDRGSDWVRLVLRVRGDYRRDTPSVSDVAQPVTGDASGLGAWAADDPAAVLQEVEGLSKRGPGRDRAQARTHEKAQNKTTTKTGSKAGGKATTKATKAGSKTGKPAGSKADSPSGDGARGDGKNGAQGAGAKASAGKHGKDGQGGAPQGGTKDQPTSHPKPGKPGKPGTPEGDGKGGTGTPEKPVTTPGEESPDPQTPVDCPDGSTAASEAECTEDPGTSPEEPQSGEAGQDTGSTGQGTGGAPAPSPTDEPAPEPPAQSPAKSPDEGAGDAIEAAGEEELEVCLAELDLTDADLDTLDEAGEAELVECLAREEETPA